MAGRPAWVGRLRERSSQLLDQRSAGDRSIGWVAEHSDVLRVAAIALAIVVLFLTGIGFVPVIVVGLILGLALWAISAAARRAEVAG